MTEKLNEWTVFKEKYKELCEWLTNMESKVSQNGDISIEEMIEKLRKVNRNMSECHLYCLLRVLSLASVKLVVFIYLSLFSLFFIFICFVSYIFIDHKTDRHVRGSFVLFPL